MNNLPDHLFLPPEAFDGFNKYMNIYGKEHVCVGDPYVEFARLEAVQAHPSKFGVELQHQYVPGVWRCPKCNFRQINSYLNMGDGTITANPKPCDCPNCKKPMWRVTWKDEANEANALLEAIYADQLIPNNYLTDITRKAYTSAETAKLKYPQPNYTTLKIAEEAGEIIRAAVHYAENRMEWAEVEAEAIQTIAMIFRLLTEGDEINNVIPPHLMKEADS